MHELVNHLESTLEVSKNPPSSTVVPSSFSSLPAPPVIIAFPSDGSTAAPLNKDLGHLLSASSLESLNYRVLNGKIFDALSNACFRHLVQTVLPSFTLSPSYAAFKTELSSEDAMAVGVGVTGRKLKVRVDDFSYIKLLGKGGFARVVHVMKKSTRQHYAMKIQSKVALVKFHGMNEGGLELEKTMIANNPNPFIVDLHYSLQTDLTAILVLGLVGGGDLSDLIFSSPRRRLPEDLAKIYAFEIGFALNHLHENGVVFRDLKPSNVLVDDSGHLKLTDMGLAAPLYVYEESKQKQGEDNIKGASGREDSDKVVGGKKNHSSNGSDKSAPKSAIEMAMEEGMKEAEVAPGGKAGAADRSSAAAPPPAETFKQRIDKTVEDRKKRGSLNFGEDESNYGGGARSKRRSVNESGFATSEPKLPLSNSNSNPLAYDNLETVTTNPWELEKTDKVPIRRKSIVGTRAYLAPEMLEQTFESERPGYTKKVDYFALGVTLFEMSAGRRPWHEFEPGKGNRSSEIADPFAMSSENLMAIIQLRQDRKKFPPGYISKLHKIEWPDHFSKDLIDICKNLLERDPEVRYDFNACILHKWMSGLDATKMLSKDKSVIPGWVTDGIKSRKNKFMDEGTAHDGDVASKYKDFSELMDELKQKDKHHAKLSWGAETVLTNDAQKLFADWDYMSSGAVKSELGMYGYEHSDTTTRKDSKRTASSKKERKQQQQQKREE